MHSGNASKDATPKENDVTQRKAQYERAQYSAQNSSSNIVLSGTTTHQQYYYMNQDSTTESEEEDDLMTLRDVLKRDGKKLMNSDAAPQEMDSKPAESDQSAEMQSEDVTAAAELDKQQTGSDNAPTQIDSKVVEVRVPSEQHDVLVKNGNTPTKLDNIQNEGTSVPAVMPDFAHHDLNVPSAQERKYGDAIVPEAMSEDEEEENTPFEDTHIDLCSTLFDIFLEDTVNSVVEAKAQQITDSITWDNVMRRRVREYQQECLPKTKRKTLLTHSTSEETDDEDDNWEQRIQTPNGYAFGMIPPREMLLNSDMPLDEFTHRVTQHMDDIYQQYAWKMEWQNLQRNILQRHLLEVLEQNENTAQSAVQTESSTILPPSEDEIRTHPMYAAYGKNLPQLTLDSLDEMDLAAALKIGDKEAYNRAVNEIQEKAKQRRQVEKSSTSRSTRIRTRKRNVQQVEIAPGEVAKIHEEEEVLIPTFRIVEDEDFMEDSNHRPDVYSRIVELMQEEHRDLTIIDLAGDVYPYYIHMQKELKEKRRIWRCWHGGSLKDPEDMTEEERKKYEEKEKTLPKMPEFKVSSESYLFAPVPTSDERGNYESMKAKALAFRKRKEEEEAKRRAEEAEKRNRKKRKRVYSYTDLPSDEDELLTVDDGEFVPEQRPKRRGPGRPPKHAQDYVSPEEIVRSTPRIKRRKTSSCVSTRSAVHRDAAVREDSLELIEEDDLMQIEEVEESERWQLTENTGSQMHWKDALAGRAIFVLRFKRITT